MESSRHAILTGVVLMVIGTLFASGADAALKAVATDYAAPQVLLIAAIMSMMLTLGVNFRGGVGRVVHTGAPVAMAGRCGATVVAAVGFYNAFVLIPFAQVFLFIGAMPLMAAVLSGWILGERAGGRNWLVLGIGFLGLLCLVPTMDTEPYRTGHLYAAVGSLAGTLSVVLSRHIGRHETHSLAQVFLPQLAVAGVMLILLPSVVHPMTQGDFLLVCFYAVMLFCARWILVIVARMLPAWLTLQLLNMQFVWMVALGTLVFHETTGPLVFLGAALIICAGMILARQEMAKCLPSRQDPDKSLQMSSSLRQGAALVRHAALATKTPDQLQRE
jgi:drug/metabolite transporter (DMT)-like permease